VSRASAVAGVSTLGRKKGQADQHDDGRRVRDEQRCGWQGDAGVVVSELSLFGGSPGLGPSGALALAYLDLLDAVIPAGSSLLPFLERGLLNVLREAKAVSASQRGRTSRGGSRRIDEGAWLVTMPSAAADTGPAPSTSQPLHSCAAWPS